MNGADDIIKFRNLLIRQPFDKDLWKYKGSLYPEDKIGYHKGIGPYFYYVLDWETGKYVHLSKGIKDILGYDDDFWEAGAEAVFSIIHPEDFEAFKKMTEKWMSILLGKSEEDINQYSANFNFRIRKKNNEYINILQQPIYTSLDRAGNIIYDAGIVMDISRYRNDGEMSLLIVGPDNKTILEYFPKKEEVFKNMVGNVQFSVLNEIDGMITNPFVRNLKNTIRNNLHRESFGVKELSEMMTISRSCLYRKLKEVVNIPPNQLILLYRMKEAVKLLSQEQKSIAEIAFSVGFKSPTYFTKRFHDVFDHPPRVFRLQRKKNH